jgi:FMN phosphatase YigB (HAD superfamily)
MHDTLLRLDSLRALILDVDGTLYRQAPVRRAMARRIVRTHATRPWTGMRVARVLVAYREAQETLRASGFQGDVALAQTRLAAERTRVDPEEVAKLARRWMEEAPLDVIASSGRPGLVEALGAAAGRGIKLAALSDYPAERKLEALGVADRFDVILSAQDPRVQAFKPSPRGLLVALSELDVEPSDALYVGDRADVDVAAAAAADVRCLLIGSRQEQVRDDAGPVHVDLALLANCLERR